LSVTVDRERICWMAEPLGDLAKTVTAW